MIYNPIADGAYVIGAKNILVQSRCWRKMSDKEKALFDKCTQCKQYSKYRLFMAEMESPCANCPNAKTEVYIDNCKKTMLHKYL